VRSIKEVFEVKMCVTAASKGLDASVDSRFGRCRYFVILDSDTMELEIVENASVAASSGAGIQAAQTIVNKGVEVVITGNVGPNAFQVLSSAGVKVVTGADGRVRDVVEKYEKGELKERSGPTVGGHFGIGGRRGRGW
jgi:predicted Fe-Mo cluster-binding NifX family protein